MKKIIAFVLLLVCSSLGFTQTKTNLFDLNYNLTYRDNVGLRWTSKFMGEFDTLKMQGFNSNLFWQTKIGNSSLRIVADMYQLPGASFIGTRYGFNFINGGPSSNINISIFSNDNFSNLTGLSGKIDVNMKFK